MRFSAFENTVRSTSDLEPGQKQTLDVDHVSQSSDQAVKWLERIKRDCSSYLDAVHKAKHWLYRGGRGPDAYIAKSWNQRFPKDSNAVAQQLFDHKLAELGFVALRSNSIFATSDIYQASEYGDRVYVIFPIDNHSSFTYTNEHDLVLDEPDDVGIDRSVRDQWVKITKESIVEWLKNYNKPTPRPLTTLLRILNQIQIFSWHQISDAISDVKKDKRLDTLPKHLWDVNLKDWLTTKQFVERWNPSNQDLSQAIEKQLEVYISGSYYALDINKYGQLLNSFFEVATDSRDWIR
jgi:hypothetical protein